MPGWQTPATKSESTTSVSAASAQRKQKQKRSPRKEQKITSIAQWLALDFTGARREEIVANADY